MAWVYLFAAGLLEIGWAIGLKYSHGFTRPLPSVLTVLAMILSMVLLGMAIRTIPIGTGYAIWTGIGAVGAAILGMVLFHDPATPLRIGFLSLIVIGIIGLKFAGGGEEHHADSPAKVAPATRPTEPRAAE